MGLDDLVNKGKDLLNSDKAEQVSDDLIEKASDFADQRTGGKYAEQLDKAVQQADKRIGTQ